MRTNLIIISLFLTIAISAAHAETIYLKDGRVIKGKIINRGAYDVTIREGAMPRKYYNDQILRIEQDEAPAGSARPAGQAMSEEKIALIVEFIKVSGMRQSMEATIERIVTQAPVEKQAELRILFNISGIVQQLIPVYDKYYSSEELREIIVFYKTPAGQKMIQVTPQIINEFMQASVAAIKQHSKP